jgi:two-component system KDP operon response regulator KdpE
MARKLILIVEDDAAARQVMQLRLRAHYDVMALSDIITGMTEARKNPPDLIILDLGLPGGGGLAFLERLQAIPRLGGVPVIVVSAHERSQAESQSLAAGAAAYFQKPADPEKLLQKIRELLREDASGTSA